MADPKTGRDPGRNSDLDSLFNSTARVLKSSPSVKTEIRSVSDLLEILKALYEGKNPGNLEEASNCISGEFTLGNFWFRGESQQFEQPLTPSIVRYLRELSDPSHYKKRNLLEGKLINYSELMANERLWADARFPFNVDNMHLFHKLVILQHYRAKTRLLDWTLNPLVALYFAASIVNSPSRNEDADGVLFILDPKEFNKDQSFGLYKDCGFSPDINDFSALARLAFIFRDPAFEERCKRSVRMNLSINKSSSTFKESLTIYLTFCSWALGLNNLLRGKLSMSRILSEVPLLQDYLDKSGMRKVLQKSKLLDDRLADTNWIKLFDNTEDYVTESNFNNYIDLFKAILAVYSRPIAIFPSWIFERMRLQQSTFVLFGGTLSPVKSEEIKLRSMLKHWQEKNGGCPEHEWQLLALRIPKENKPDILEQLRLLSIHRATLFGDEPSELLEGLFDYLLLT